jgi:endoglucanase
MKNPLPRWRGFNLVEKWLAAKESLPVDEATDGHFGRLEPYREDDFRWIADWGFDCVRLPLSYHCWSDPDPDRWLEMDERVIRALTGAIRAEAPDRLIIADGVDWCGRGRPRAAACS